MMRLRAGALALFQEGRFQTVALYPLPAAPQTTLPQMASLQAESLRSGPGNQQQSETPHKDDPSHSEQELPAQHYDVHPVEARARPDDQALQQRFARAAAELAGRHVETIVSGTASDLLGPELASDLHWNDCVVVRLPGSTGELAGLLCLSGRSRPLASEDRELIEAIAGHAAMALDNARLFTRVEQLLDQLA